MNDAIINRFLRVMKNNSDISNRPDTMISGEVKSIDPLEIDIGNNIILTEEFLFLGQNCRPHKVTIPHRHLINALMAESTKSIITKSITAGVAVDVPQTTGKYDIKTQTVTRNEDGTNTRDLNTENQSGVDLGGATLAMNINVAGSPIAGSLGSGTVTSTVDLSTFTPTDDGHQHIVPEHETHDVHFPATETEDSVEIEIYPRLAVGDIVLLFAFNNYQKYYVAERIRTN